MPTPPLPSHPRLWPWPASLLLVCALLYAPYVAGRVPGGADTALFMIPVFSVPWDDGLPLWDRWQAGGSPLIDNLQTCPLYPLRVPFYFLANAADWFGLYTALHWMIAALGVWALMRELTWERRTAWAGAVIFVAGGHMAGRALSPIVFYGCAWLPLLLAGAAGCARRHVVATAGATAMILLTGSPHAIFYGAVGYAIVFAACVAVPIARAAGGMDRWRPMARTVVLAVGAALLGLVIASPTFLGGLARSRTSLRAEATAATNLADSVARGDLPRVFLGGTGGGLFPEYIDASCFIGSLGLLAVVAALWGRAAWRDRRTIVAVSLVVAGVFFALGENVGLAPLMRALPLYRELAGPPRALLLAALGLAMLTAGGLERLSARTPWQATAAIVAVGLLLLGVAILRGRELNGGSLAPLAGGAFAAWALAPRAVPPTLFPWIDGGLFLLVAAAVLAIPTRFARLRWWSLMVIVVAQLAHFHSRVTLDPPPPHFFQPDATLERARPRSPETDTPYRVLAFDALRYNHSSYESADPAGHLAPKLSMLFNLDDAHGFDPLIARAYRDLLRDAAGLAPWNDPLRTVFVTAPTRELVESLGVRYVLGNPYDRQLTNLPQVLHGREKPREDVTAWGDLGTTAAITGWSFVSLLDGAVGMPLGHEVARLHVQAAEGSFVFPVRNGHETADVAAWGWYQGQPRGDEFVATPHAIWSSGVMDDAFEYRRTQANYRGEIDFGRPLHVQSITWECVRPVVFFVAAQAYRLAAPPLAADDPWRRVEGREVWEWKEPVPRAVVVAGGCEATAAEVSISAERLRGDSPAGTVRWLERRTNSFALEVDATAPALLYLRETWVPGWRATIDGRETPVLRANGVFRAIEVPAGRSTVRCEFRPPHYIIGRWFALAGVLALVLIATIRRRPRDAAATRTSGPPTPSP